MDFSKMVSYGMVFHQQIRRTMETAKDKEWEWENCLPGPISKEERELVMAIAGCWCVEHKNGCIRFFTTNKHPCWSLLRQPLV